MPRGLLIFAFCLPLAILMGFMLSDPLMGRNMAIISLAMFALLIPLGLTLHHRLVVWTAAAYMTAFFLPGQPSMWMVFAAMSFGIAVLSRPLGKAKMKPVWDRSVMASLVCLMIIVVVTAVVSGGVGMRVLGSAMYGGRKYVWLIAAVIGFLALTMGVIPRRNVHRDMAIYTLAPMTAAVSNLAYMLGPGFYFLFLLFPVEMAVTQAQADFSPLFVAVKRYNGFGPASIGIMMFCFMKWGVRGVLQMNKPYRILLMAFALFIGLFSGFRSTLAICFAVGVVQFFAEGLHRTRYLAAVTGFAVLMFVFLAAFAERLPLAAQRAISFLPVKVDQTTAFEANGSLQWRFEMWRAVVQEIPRHFWIGKGYAVDPTDLYFSNEAMRRGFASDYEASMKAGDYHSGPLSIIVPFGIFGVLCFVWFTVASIRVLWRNMRHSDDEVRNINTFLFSYFVGRLFFFVIFFGALEADLWLFASIVGLSLALNGGVKGRPEAARVEFDRKGLRGRNREAELAEATV